MDDLHTPIRLSPGLHRHVCRMRDYIAEMEHTSAQPHDGISGVPGIPYALCYDTGKPGPTAAILAGTHMSELTGFAAANHFHERWMQGEWPESGKVYVMVGGHAPSIKHLIGELLKPDPTITLSQLIGYRTRIVDEQGHDCGKFNHNDIPLRYRDERSSMEEDEPLLKRVGKITDVLSTCDAGVLDIHSLTEDIEPDALPYTTPGDDEASVLRKLDRAIKGMPIAYVPLFKDMRHLQPGDPGYIDAVSGMRSFARIHPDAVSLIVETGGHLSEKSWDFSTRMVDQWLENIGVMKNPKKWQGRAPAGRTYLHEIGNLYHPTNYPPEKMEAFRAKLSAQGMDDGAIDRIVHDHYFLVHDLAQLEHGPAEGYHWSPEARAAISWAKEEGLFGERETSRLSFFAPVHKGDVLAIGLATGHLVQAERDGHVLMVNRNPDLNLEGTAFGYQGSGISRLGTSPQAEPARRGRQ